MDNLSVLSRLLKKPSPTMVGIDVGSHYVKGVMLAQHQGVYQLLAFGLEKVPEKLIINGEIQDISALEVVVRDLKVKLLNQYNQLSLWSQQVKIPAVSALATNAVLIKAIDLNVVLNNGLTKEISDEQLHQQILIQADSLIPYPIHEVSFDFERLTIDQQDPAKVQLLLSVARTQHVESLAEVIDNGGFATRIIEVEHHALIRALPLCWQSSADYQKREASCPECIAVIDLGALRLVLTVVRHQVILYTQEYRIDINSQEVFPYTITDNTQALLWFKTYVLPVINEGLNGFVASRHSVMIDQLVICGGWALNTKIAQQITTELGIQTMIADPFVAMQVANGMNMSDLKKISAQFMLATGLALRGFSQCHT